MKMKYRRQRCRAVREWMGAVLRSQGHNTTLIQGYIATFEDDDELFEFDRDVLDEEHNSPAVAEQLLTSSYINYLETCLLVHEYRMNNCPVRKALSRNATQHQPQPQKGRNNNDQ